MREPKQFLNVELIYPKMAAALKVAPNNISAKDFFNNYLKDLDEKIKSVKSNALPEELKNIDNALDLSFVGRNRLIPSLQTFCNEFQAFIVETNATYINHKRLGRLVPSCNNDTNPYNLGKISLSDNLSPKEYMAELEENIMSSIFNSKQVYSKDFSEIYGMNEFKDIFNPKNCNTTPASFERYTPPK